MISVGRNWVWALVTLASSAFTAERIPDGVEVVDVSVTPERIELANPYVAAQLLITGHLETGEQIDLTRISMLHGESSVVEVTENRLVRPKSNGSETLQFSAAGFDVNVNVEVSGVGDEPSVSFVRDVAPVLSKMGCNNGSCHGSKDGQDGFKLSLRGYDFEYDHRALTDDIGSRRFNRAAPDQSLMLLKASAAVPHVGGQLAKPGDPYYEILRSWIAAGCKLDLKAPRVTSIQLLPDNPVVPRAGIKQQMIVLAAYSDGTTRDVTAEAFIESGNIEILSADKSGLISVLRRGEAPVLARYEGAYTATTITIMGDRSGFEWNDPPANNYIDEFVYEKLQRVKVLPSQLASDEEFVRRLYLDITGLPPTADQVREFVADNSDGKAKRDQLIDMLVGNADYVEHWTNKWADMLQVNRKFLGETGAAILRDWIKDSIASNKPYDEFAYEILTASGSNMDNPAASYWKVLRDPASAMENTTHLFLAVRFNCNKCHDHPFERWTQDQYYNLTAYFSQVARKADPAFAGQKIGGSAVESAVPLVEVVYDSGKGETTHDRTGQIVSPSFPYKHSYESEETNRREELAAWITSSDNRYFASSYVNRLWGYLMGVGLIEPIDDIRAGNPPTNPELLKALTQEFIESGFDVRHMLKSICKSRTYQLSVATNKWNVDDTINYSHALPRRLPAEVLFDAIHTATGTETRIAGLPPGFRAAELPDVGIKLPFLDDFGRPARESSCECERATGVVLGPIMKLINGPTVANALTDPNNALTKLVADETDDSKVIEELFLRFLSRRPTAKEIELCTSTIKQAGQDSEVIAKELSDLNAKIAKGISQWEATLSDEPVWTPVELTDVKSDVGAEFQTLDDGSTIVSGKLEKDVYRLTAQLELRKVTGIRLEVFADDHLPAKGPGRADNGNFVLNELTVELQSNSESSKIKLQNGTADFSQSNWDVAGAIDGNASSGWAVSPQFGKNHVAIFEAAEAYSVTEDSRILFSLSQQFDGKHNIGRFRLAVTDSPRPLAPAKLPDELKKALKIAAGDRNENQHKIVRDYFLKMEKPVWKESLDRLLLLSEQAKNPRLTGVQDVAWALINNPAFLFNR